MSNQAVPSTGPSRVMPLQSMRPRALKPPVLVPLFVGAAIAGAALPLLIGHAPFEHRANERPIDHEDSSLCARFEFVPGSMQSSECKAALADLRHQHERLLLH